MVVQPKDAKPLPATGFAAVVVKRVSKFWHILSVCWKRRNRVFEYTVTVSLFCFSLSPGALPDLMM